MQVLPKSLFYQMIQCFSGKTKNNFVKTEISWKTIENSCHKKFWLTTIRKIKSSLSLRFVKLYPLLMIGIKRLDETNDSRI